MAKQNQPRLDDVPQAPELKKSLQEDDTLWQKFKETTKPLSPDRVVSAIQAKLQQSKQKIKAKIDRGEKLTDKEIEEYNEIIRAEATNIFDTTKERTLELILIAKSDNAEVVSLKMRVQERMLEWLKDLLAWILKKLTEIFCTMGAVAMGIPGSVFGMLKELFTSLYTSMTS